MSDATDAEAETPYDYPEPPVGTVYRGVDGHEWTRRPLGWVCPTCPDVAPLTWAGTMGRAPLTLAYPATPPRDYHRKPRIQLRIDPAVVAAVRAVAGHRSLSAHVERVLRDDLARNSADELED